MQVAQPEPDVEHEFESEPIRIGRTLGRYLLCYELASGGMATVYLARSGGFGRLVALKLIHPHLARKREFVDMFFDEARIAARIVHPNVCSVFDFGEEDGAYFLAMDYLAGETLWRLTRAAWRQPSVAMRPSTQRVFARIVADACEGLHAAHEARSDDGTLLGVVHRDVSPHNLFVGYDGAVRIVDFGVAMSLDRSHHTAAGTVKGKLPYLSPEQVKLEAVDRRSDVWSLGVCLWELLSGRPLHGRDSDLETLQAVTGAPIPEASAAGPHVPALFDPIIARALSRDLGARYATTREMGRDLAVAIGLLGGSSAADVAELMDELFRRERVARLQLLERAHTLEPESPRRSNAASVRDGEGATGRRHAERRDASAAEPVPAEPTRPARTLRPGRLPMASLRPLCASSTASFRCLTALTEPFEAEPGATPTPLDVVPDGARDAVERTATLESEQTTSLAVRYELRR